MAYKNREDALAYNKEYYRLNKEKNLESIRKWTKNNLDKVKTYKRKYREKNKEKLEKLSEYAREYRKENRDKIRISKKRYVKNNLKQRCVYQHNYMARKRASGDSFTIEDINNLYVIQGARCYYCSVSIEDRYHRDHMTPLIKGGSNLIDNICLTCVRCNLSKHTKTADEYILCLQKL